MINFLSLKKFLKNWPIIVGTMAIILTIVMIHTLTQPLEYRSTIQLLIVQSPVAEVDTYTAARSAEKLGSNLAQVILTSSFREQVISTNSYLGENLGENEEARRKEWRRKLEVSVIPETAIMKISYYDEAKERAQGMVDTIGYILSTQAKDYYGGGDEVKIKMVENPLTSKRPVRPNIIINILGSLSFGLILSIFFMAIKKEKIGQGLSLRVVSGKSEDSQEIEGARLPWENSQVDEQEREQRSEKESFVATIERKQTPQKVKEKKDQFFSMTDHLAGKRSEDLEYYSEQKADKR